LSCTFLATNCASDIIGMDPMPCTAIKCCNPKNHACTCKSLPTARSKVLPMNNKLKHVHEASSKLEHRWKVVVIGP